MKPIADSRFLDFATFAGIMLGFSLLVVSYFSDELRYLALPALAVLFPALIYGTR
jgi:hypothetical protein